MKTNISVSFNESYSFVQFCTFIYGFVRVYTYRTFIHSITIRNFCVYNKFFPVKIVNVENCKTVRNRTKPYKNVGNRRN